MADHFSLELSDGTGIDHPTSQQVTSALQRIGVDPDHCILQISGETEFVEATGGKRSLVSAG